MLVGSLEGSHDRSFFCECFVASVIVSGLALSPPLHTRNLELDPLLGQFLYLLFLRLLSISITVVLSYRNNYVSEF